MSFPWRRRAHPSHKKSDGTLAIHIDTIKSQRLLSLPLHGMIDVLFGKLSGDCLDPACIAADLQRSRKASADAHRVVSQFVRGR